MPYLVASLGLSNQNEGIGADNGEAEVDEDHRALRADIPGGRNGESEDGGEDEACCAHKDVKCVIVVLLPGGTYFQTET